MELREIGRAAVGQDDAAVTAVVSLAHGGVDADLGGDAGDDQILDAAIPQRQLQVGLEECALAGLIDHRLAFDRIKLWDDVVAGLAAHQDAAHRSGVADAQRRRAALDLGRRCIRQIRAVALARVDHQHAGRARSAEDGPARADRGLQQRDVVTERFAEPAGLEEIALHVDDDERSAIELDCNRLRLGDNLSFHHPPRGQ